LNTNENKVESIIDLQVLLLKRTLNNIYLRKII